MVVQGTLFIISAPSGAGKTSLINAMLEDFKSEYPLERVITYTTKQPRFQEVAGKDYHFLSKEIFEIRAKQGFFLEWSTDYISYYGTPADIKDALARGRSLVLVIDRRGAQQILAQIPDAVLIWVYTKNLEILETRLRKRGTELEAQITHRIARAHIEIESERSQPLYPYHILNDIFEEALIRLKQIVLSEMGRAPKHDNTCKSSSSSYNA